MAGEQWAGKSEYVTVRIYDQTYHLSGQNPDHIQALAAKVDATMRTVSSQGRTVDTLRVAVLAALNLADEIAQLKAQLKAQKPAPAPKPVSKPASKLASIQQQQVRARAANLRGLLDEVLAGGQPAALKTGS
jgi:cell division protein ZapA